MTIDSEERERLHTILDALINARNRLDAADLKLIKRKGLWQSARLYVRHEFFEMVLNLARYVIGDKLHNEEFELLHTIDLTKQTESPDDALILAYALNTMAPFLVRPENRRELGETKEVIRAIIDDLEAVSRGDQSRLIPTPTGKQGLNRRPFRIAKLRHTALKWDKILIKFGVPTQERRRVISTAYRTDWEAIRKWPNSIWKNSRISLDSPSHIDYLHFECADNLQKIYEHIQRDGDVYWRERSNLD